MKVLDNLAWDYIPSAIGLHGNLTWSGGAGAEVNLTPVELLLIANWRSGEISLMLSMEGSGMFTLPDLFGLSLNGGVTEVYGASTNSELEGWAHFGGYSLSAGEVLNIGVSQNYGAAKKDVWGTENYIDPISGREVKYSQSTVFAALSAPVVASPVDGSLFGGVSYTKELYNRPLPYWPLR